MSPGCRKQPAVMGTEVRDGLPPNVREPGVAGSEPGPEVGQRASWEAVASHAVGAGTRGSI